jgi:hypothetical protein
MNKEFKDLNDGEVFKFRNTEFTKIPLIRVSCCRNYNAQSTANADQKIFIKPEQEVEVNDQL